MFCRNLFSFFIIFCFCVFFCNRLKIHGAILLCRRYKRYDVTSLAEQTATGSHAVRRRAGRRLDDEEKTSKFRAQRNVFCMSYSFASITHACIRRYHTCIIRVPLIHVSGAYTRTAAPVSIGGADILLCTYIPALCRVSAGTYIQQHIYAAAAAAAAAAEQQPHSLGSQSTTSTGYIYPGDSSSPTGPLEGVHAACTAKRTARPPPHTHRTNEGTKCHIHT